MTQEFEVYIDYLQTKSKRRSLNSHFSYCPIVAYLGKSAKWPGSARDLRAQVNRKENGELMVADFRWKPPHDCKLPQHDYKLAPHDCKIHVALYFITTGL